MPPSLINKFKTPPDDSDNYKHSGLKEERAKEYTQKLIDFIEKTEAWKDSELSVTKISVEFNLPKHYISQILYENINKNFYTFFNEYRV